MAYHIMDMGASGDGKTNDAYIIQQAIDKCDLEGGGTVVLDGGHTYLSGSIVLKSNVELMIEKGAVLKASENLNDYNYISEIEKIGHNHGLEVPTFVNCEYNGKPRQYFIYAKDADGVCISGRGTIDGSEEIYYGEIRKDQIDGAFYPRIPMILMEHCTHLTIKEVTIRKSGFWTTHLVGCEEVDITGICILNNRMMANCDGIDPDHCKHVRISNCHIEAADDCVVLKTTEANKKYGDCEDIIISGCTLASTSAAIKIGTESVNDFRNIIIRGCTIYDTNRGISFQLRDEGNIENVIISDCIINTRNFSECWWGCAEPINIASINRKNNVPSGNIRCVLINNVICTGEGGIYIAGKENAPIYDLTINNVRLTLEKNTDYPISGYDFRPCAGPDFYRGKINGVYVKNSEKVTTNNIYVTVKEEMKQYVDKDICIDEISRLSE
ncbi:MAG: glycosyl hydrolase family 28 protein [Eubacteriales bacterium]|nr:glycosyl hydrolase family 28 protein [Eubacteriales bacterium]